MLREGAFGNRAYAENFGVFQQFFRIESFVYEPGGGTIAVFSQAAANPSPDSVCPASAGYRPPLIAEVSQPGRSVMFRRLEAGPAI
jgi:hypothetical protein